MERWRGREVGRWRGREVGKWGGRKVNVGTTGVAS